MPTSVADIVSKMRQALALSEPDLDTTIGTPVRKILDAVGEVVAEASIDTYLLDYQYDIDSRTGADLDDFVALFGFTRLAAKRATGTVLFERQDGTSVARFLIPLGSQVATGDATPVVFQTQVAAVLLPDETSVSVPIQAIRGGASGNVAAHSIQRRVSPLPGVSSVSNPTAMIGGADVESDSQLRDRFKRTVFRNLAGTEGMFLGVALDDQAVTQANVIGASKRLRGQIEIADGEAEIAVGGSYIYPGSMVFGSDIDAGLILVPAVNYNFDYGTGLITVLTPGTVPDGIYDMEFEYLPEASRNDPLNGITNRIDVYVNGARPTSAPATLVFKTGRTFTDGGGIDLADFQRLSGDPPLEGNYFVAFPLGPVSDPSVSDQITIGGQPFVEGRDYWLVNDITEEGGTPSSRSGIEFTTTPGEPPGALSVPADNAVFTINYVYNAVPRDVDRAIRVWRLITTDVQVHAAKSIRLRLFMAVMYQAGFTETVVRPEVEAALADYISKVGFNGVVQVSDLLGVVQRVSGVDAVRFLSDADPWVDEDDGEHWAIERVSEDGTFLTVYDSSSTPKQAVDLMVGEDELPVFDSVTLVAKAQNTFFRYLDD